MSNISLITKLGLIVTTVGTLTVGVRYASNFDNIEEAINTLKDRGVAYYNMATTSKEELATLQSKYDNLNAIYLGVLDKLALEEGATIEDIETKIDSMVSEGNTDTLNAIGALIGLEAPVTADNVTQALNSMNEQLTALEDKVTTLEAELAQARADLTQANSEQEQITALLEACMAQVPAIEEEEPGDPVEPELTEEQQALKATMESAWLKVQNSKLSEDILALVKDNDYTTSSSYGTTKKLNVNGQEYNITSDQREALDEYKTAKTNYLNAGGTLE